MEALQFSIEINAKKERVWTTLWEDKTFREWANIIDEGTFMKGFMEEGNEVQFISSVNGYGVTSLIEKLSPNAFALIVKTDVPQELVEMFEIRIPKALERIKTIAEKGRIILMMGVTLNGCCDHTQMIADEALHQYSMDLMDKSDGMLFGRKIYQLMESYWPNIVNSGVGTQFEVDFAHKIDQKSKYVVSRTLDNVSWNNSYLLKGPISDAITQLIREGKTLLVNGGPGLGSTLAQLGLVDEYHFFVQPTIVGCSPQLLGGVNGRLDLKLTETKVFESGVVLLKYMNVR